MTTRFAVADPETGRIDRYIDLPDGWVVLPFVEVAEDIGENQLPGPPVVTVEAGRVVATMRPVRALSGWVAVLDADGAFLDKRDLGADLIQVAENVRPYREILPEYDPASQVREGPVLTIGDDLVENVWTVRDKTKDEIAAADDARKERDLIARFGDLGLAAALDQENRLRRLEGEEPITLETFKAREKAKL